MGRLFALILVRHLKIGSPTFLNLRKPRSRRWKIHGTSENHLIGLRVFSCGRYMILGKEDMIACSSRREWYGNKCGLKENRILHIAIRHLFWAVVV